VLFQSKLALEGVEGALDPLADTPKDPCRRGSSARSGRSSLAP
jgi:hypothetical protein